jgi:hypothetical protein
MKRLHSGPARALAGLGLLVALAGCATPAKFSPPGYAVDPSRPYRLSSSRTVAVCPAFDRLSAETRDQIDPAFNPAAYLTDAVDKELAAAGIAHIPAGFAYSPSFAGVQKALKEGALGQSGVVVLAEAINHFPNDRMISCDFELYSEHGQLLFEKRCLCMSFAAGGDRMFAAHMVMQQLFADPGFQRAIQ